MSRGVTECSGCYSRDALKLDERRRRKAVCVALPALCSPGRDTATAVQKQHRTAIDELTSHRNNLGSPCSMMTN
jgi:hypothetical protein